MIREQTAYGLGRLAALARQQEWSAGEAASLTPTQGDALRLLADRPSGLRLTELAGQLSVRASTASDAVSTLVAKGLVARAPDPENARAVRISLTPSGMQMLGHVPEGFLTIVDMLSDADAEALHAIVLRTIARLQKTGRIAPQRLCVTCRYFVSEASAEPPGGHFCRLVNQPLRPADLRINCPEHETSSPDG